MSSESVTFPDRLEPASIDDLDHEPGQINRFLAILVEELAFQNKAGIVTIRVPFSIEQTLTGSCAAREKGYDLDRN